MDVINKFDVKKHFDFKTYTNFIENLFQVNLVSGGEQSQAKLDATKINLQRMKRIYKTISVSEFENLFNSNVEHDWTWILIVEGWCGDGAQNLPIIAKIAEQFPNIDLKIILRDENSDLMNAYLTNGGRAIPKLICIDTDTNQELGTWGPRTSFIQEKVDEYKKGNNIKANHDDFVANLHLWYARDKGISLKYEIMQNMKSWMLGY